MKFKDIINDNPKEINEGVSNDAKEFMKEFNKQVSLLKEEIKTSETNSDWKHRLESISILINKIIKK